MLPLLLNSAPPSINCHLFSPIPAAPIGFPLVVQLECISTAQQRLDLGANHLGNLVAAITTPDGQHKTVSFRIPDFSGPGIVEVAPNQPYTQRINFGEAFMPSAPGKYYIELMIKNNEESIKTQATLMRIEPEDKDQIAALCLHLAQEITNAKSWIARMELAKELSSVHRDEAVQPIGTVLGKGLGIDDQLITGLRQTSSMESLRLLDSYMQSANPDDRQLALNAVSAMRTEASDPDVRQEADRMMSMQASPQNKP